MTQHYVALLSGSESRSRRAPAAHGFAVIVVSRVRFIRESLVHALQQCDHLSRIEATSTEFETGVLTHLDSPCVAVVDMTAADLLPTINAIRDGAPEARVVAVGVEEDEDVICACARAGVAGYVSRDASLTELLAIVQNAALGERLCSPRIAGILNRNRRYGAATGAGVLTPREREIGALVERGLGNKEIAATLRISLPTVKNHVHNVLEKLHLVRRGQIAAQLRPRAEERAAPTNTRL